jgi:hypothetical protein
MFAVSGIYSYRSAQQVEISTISLDIVEDTCSLKINLRGGAADSDALKGGDLTLDYGNEKVPLTLSGKTVSATVNTTVLTNIMDQPWLHIRGTISTKILFGLIPVSTDISRTIEPKDQGLDIENIKSTMTMSDRKTSWTDSGEIRVEMKLTADMPKNLDLRIESAPGKIETQTSTYPCTIEILELDNGGSGHVKMIMSQGTAFSLMFAESITGFSFLDT